LQSWPHDAPHQERERSRRNLRSSRGRDRAAQA
jgi:hypothetical protein